MLEFVTWKKHCSIFASNEASFDIFIITFKCYGPKEIAAICLDSISLKSYGGHTHDILDIILLKLKKFEKIQDVC
jgi:hypothetical protein